MTPPLILGLMAQQRGLVTRPQAVDLGLVPPRIDRLVRVGHWTIARRGVYAESEAWRALTDYREKRIVLDRAASLRVRGPHVMSVDSAAHLLGMQVLRPRRPLTHITRPRLVGTHLRDDVKHHLAPYHPDQVVAVDGVLALDLARTAADIAREHGNPAGVVAMDSARRLGATLDDLWRAIAPMASWPGVTLARESVERSDGDADSALETLTRELLEELGLGPVHPQFGLTADGRAAWCDFRIGRHLVECDGVYKYRRLEDGGLAVVAPEDVLVYEKQRQDWLCGFRLGMSRVVWSEVWGRSRPATKQRLIREISTSHRRYGTSVEDLTPYLARGPRVRPGRVTTGLAA